MRLIGVFGLSVIAAFAVMCLAGAGSAAASEAVMLCKEKEEHCKPEFRYLAPTKLEAKLKEATTWRLETSSGTIECSESLWAGETTSEGTTLVGTISSMSFSGCTLEKGKCSVSPLHLPYATETSATEAGNGTMAIKNGGAGEPGVAVECGFAVKCSFTREPSLPVTGGKPATVEASNLEMNRSGTVCPTADKLTAVYALVAPTENVFVSQGKTSMCSKSEPICLGANSYPKETAVEGSLESGTEAVFSREVLPVKCKGATFSAETESEEGQPLPLKIIGLGASNCNEGCSIAIATTEKGGGKLRATGGGNGKLTLEPIQIWTLCAVECVYRKAAAVLDVEGGSPAKIKAIEEPLSRLHPDTELLCSETLKWSATYVLSSPEPLFITG